MRKVAVIYHFVAEYRRPVFEALIKDPDLEVYVAADYESPTPNLKVVEKERIFSWKERFVPVENYWLFGHFLWQTRVTRVSFLRNYDTVIYLGNMYHLSTWVSAIIAKAMGRKVVFWTHGALKRETGIRGFLRRSFYRLADQYLLYGNRAKDILVSQGFHADAMYVVYNSLDYTRHRCLLESIKREEIEDFRSRLFSNPNLPIVLFLGRLTASKRPAMLLELALDLHQKDVEFNILIVGDGPVRESLVRESVRAGVSDRVRFYGATYDEKELALIHLGSSVSLIPGVVGLSAIHSLSFGVPVVTMDDMSMQKPEAEAILRGITGDFYKPDSVEDLKNALTRLLVLDHEKCSKACYSVIENFYTPQVQAEIIKHMCFVGRASQQPSLGPVVSEYRSDV